MKNTDEFPLAALKIGAKASVKKIITEGKMRRRLLDLGVVPGTIIEALYSSPWGDPIAYYIRGTVIAFRNSDASSIMMERAHE